MNLQNLEENISINLKDKTDEIKRVLHGRLNFYDNFSFLTVDSLDNTLFATFYEENSEELEIIKILKNLTLSNNFQNLIVQRKYKNSDFFESIYGEIPENFYAIENGLKYKIDFHILVLFLLHLFLEEHQKL